MAWAAYSDDTCGSMRTTLVVLLWLVATAGVVYVANAAVELVDLQVFPGGSRIEVLSLSESEDPSPTTIAVPVASEPPKVVYPSTTTMPVASSPAPSTTVAPATTTTTTTVAPATTTTTAVPATTAPPVAPTTTIAGEVPAETTTTAVPATTQPPATTTTTPVPATTTLVPATTLPPTLRLIVGTASLPEARIGENYRAELVAAGGIPPYVWILSAGSLPAGLGLSADGVIGGVVTETVDVSLLFQVSDGDGRSATSSALALRTAADRRTVVARGGTVFIDNDGDSVSLFLASPADGFSAVIVEPGGFRVEVQFVPLQGDATSFVVCEINDGLVCTTG